MLRCVFIAECGIALKIVRVVTVLLNSCGSKHSVGRRPKDFWLCDCERSQRLCCKTHCNLYIYECAVVHNGVRGLTAYIFRTRREVVNACVSVFWTSAVDLQTQLCLSLGACTKIENLVKFANRFLKYPIHKLSDTLRRTYGRKDARTTGKHNASNRKQDLLYLSLNCVYSRTGKTDPFLSSSSYLGTISLASKETEDWVSTFKHIRCSLIVEG